MASEKYERQTQIQNYRKQFKVDSSLDTSSISNLSHRQILEDIHKIIIRYRDNEELNLEDKKNGVLINIGNYLYRCLNKEFSDVLTDKNYTGSLKTLIQSSVNSEFNKKIGDIASDIVIQETQKIVSSSVSSHSSSSVTFDDSKLTTAERVLINEILDSEQFNHQYSVIYDALFSSVRKSLKQFKVKFSGKEDLVKQIANVILQIDKKYEKDIALIEEEYKNYPNRSAELIRKFKDTISKDVEDTLRKQNDRNYANGMSLKEAFINTLKHNAKIYTKNQNFVGKVISARAKDVIKTLERKIKRIQIFTYKLVHPIRYFKKNFRWWKLANSMGRLLVLSLRGLQGLLNITIGLGKFAVKSLFKISSFLYKGLKKTIVKVSSTIVKFTKNVIRFSVNTIKSTVRKITNGIRRLFNFIRNNTFFKRLYRFLRSDVGAMFLGTVAAFVKVFVLDKIFDTLKNEILEKIHEFIPETKFPSIGIGEIAENMFGDIKSFVLNDNFLHLGDIFTIIQNLTGFIEKLANEGDNVFNSIRESLSNTKIKTALEKIITYAEWAWNAAKAAATYRFTTLGLKFGKFVKHPAFAIGGLLVGFLLDTLTNNRITSSWNNKKKDDKDNSNIGVNVFLKALDNSAQNASYQNRFQTYSTINSMYSDETDEALREKKRHQLADRYFTILDDLEGLEETNTSMTETLGLFKTHESIQAIGPNVFESWFKKISTMKINGKEEQVVGNHEFFLGLNNIAKLNYLKVLLKQRQDYAENMKTRMDYEGRHNKMGLDRFIDTIHSDSEYGFAKHFNDRTYDVTKDSNLGNIDYNFDRGNLMDWKKDMSSIKVIKSNGITNVSGNVSDFSYKTQWLQSLGKALTPIVGAGSGDKAKRNMSLVQGAIDKLISDSRQSGIAGSRAKSIINDIMKEGSDPEQQLKSLTEYLQKEFQEYNKGKKEEDKVNVNWNEIIVTTATKLKVNLKKKIQQYKLDYGLQNTSAIEYYERQKDIEVQKPSANPLDVGGSLYRSYSKSQVLTGYKVIRGGQEQNVPFSSR